MAATDSFLFEVAYEHERRQPIRGWGSDFPGFMLPTDRRGWCDRHGKPVPFHPKNADEDVSAKMDWIGDWEIDKSGGNVDEEGWCYASDFPVIDTKGTGKQGVTDWVRRRKWIRKRKSNPESFVTHESNVTESESPEADFEKLTSNFPRGAHEKGSNCWSETDAKSFNIRGATYLSDRIKIKSDAAIMTLVHIDLFAASGKVDKVCECEGGFVAHRRARGDKRFMLAINFQAPPHHMVIYFAIPDGANWDTPTRTLWERFVMGDDEYRNSRWKVIPSVVEGPWVVKKSVGQKPALLGSKLVHTFIKGDDYMELDCNIYSSTTATWLVELLKGYSTVFAIDIGFCIQGNEPEELPERLLGAARISKPNLASARPVEWK